MKHARLLLWLPIPILLYLAARQVDWTRAVEVFTRWTWWQVGVVACVNGLFFGLLAYRWFFILRRSGFGGDLWTVTRARLVGFAVSYLTPGPQIGGEPAQVRYLTRRSGAAADLVIGSVMLDRLVEMVGNFGFLCIGLAVVASNELWVAPGSWISVLLPFAAALLPVTYFLGVFRGWTPVGALLRRIGPHRDRFAEHRIAVRLIDAERELVARIRREPRMVILPTAMHVALLAVSLADVGIVLGVLGLPLGFAEILIVLTASRLAFLLPIPGGLGTLEASQVGVFALLGYEPAFAVGLALYIRVRDILMAALGLVFFRSVVAQRRSLGTPAQSAYHDDHHAEEHGR